MKKILVSGLGLEMKYWSFLLNSEEKGFYVENAGFVNNSLSLKFKDGLKCEMLLESTDEALLNSVKHKGYFTVDIDTGSLLEYHYNEAKKPKSDTTGRSGSMKKRIDY